MTRRHDIDALRVLAFGLLILYHAGMLYVAPVSDWGFHLKSVHLAEWLQYPMLFLNRWRMELLFLISGLAVHFMRSKASLRNLALKRTQRLLLPLIFGMMVVIPIQPYVQGSAVGQVPPGFGSFLLHYWTGGRAAGLTWNHLWYLPYLWLYTVLLFALLPVLDSSAGRPLRAGFLRLRGSALLLLPALPLFVAGVLLKGRYPETHALAGDWYAHAIYATVFLYGYLLGTDSALWAELVRLRWRSLSCALSCFALYLFLDKFVGDLLGGRSMSPTILIAGQLVITGLRYLYCWTAITTVLGWSHLHMNHPFRWLPYAREAVYPWYILHQSLLLWLAWLLIPLGLGPVTEPALILLGTFGGCAMLHELVIRRVRWLRPLFGLETLHARSGTGASPRLADDPA